MLWLELVTVLASFPISAIGFDHFTRIPLLFHLLLFRGKEHVGKLKTKKVKFGANGGRKTEL